MKKICLMMLFVVVTAFCYPQGHSFIIFSGNSNCELSEKIAQHLGVELGKADVGRFNDGEISIQINENVRNKDVFVIQSTCHTSDGSVNDNIMELFLLVRALKRASASDITLVIPYYGYARQDRKVKPRVPISASDVAGLLESAGADRVISVDLHSGQIQGFFHKIPVNNLYSVTELVSHIISYDLESPVVVSPDAGGVARAKKFKELLSNRGVEAGLAIVIKQRADAGIVSSVNLVGEVKDRDVIIVDDMCDTGGTLVGVVHELKKAGAKNVYVCVAHPVFSKDALQRIASSEITEMIITDTIPLREDLPDNVTQISVAPLLAKAMNLIHNGQSVACLFED